MREVNHTLEVSSLSLGASRISVKRVRPCVPWWLGSLWHLRPSPCTCYVCVVWGFLNFDSSTLLT